MTRKLTISSSYFEPTMPRRYLLPSLLSFTVLVCVVFAFVWSSQRHRPLYSITDLGSLTTQSEITIPLGINEDSTVVGVSRSDMGFRAFLWKSGAMTGLDTECLLHTWSEAINDRGERILTYEVPAKRNPNIARVIWSSPHETVDPATRPPSLLVHSSEAWTEIGKKPTVATDVNNLGQVVGMLLSLDTKPLTAFVWDASCGLRNLDCPQRCWGAALAINDLGTIAGYIESETGERRACKWTEEGNLEYLDVATNSEAQDINNLGQIVGTCDGRAPGTWSEPQGGEAFLWDRGECTQLGTLGGKESIARAINDLGQVVGLSWTLRESLSGPVQLAYDVSKELMRSDTLGGVHAFLWEDGRMHDLNDLVHDCTGDCEIWDAMDINDNGEIAAYGEYLRGFLLTPISATTKRSICYSKNLPCSAARSISLTLNLHPAPIVSLNLEVSSCPTPPGVRLF